MIQTRFSSRSTSPLSRQHISQQIPSCPPAFVKEGHCHCPSLVSLTVLTSCLHVQSKGALQQALQGRSIHAAWIGCVVLSKLAAKSC